MKFYYVTNIFGLHTFDNETALKIDEKLFLFYLKGSYSSQDI